MCPHKSPKRKTEKHKNVQNHIKTDIYIYKRKQKHREEKPI